MDKQLNQEFERTDELLIKEATQAVHRELMTRGCLNDEKVHVAYLVIETAFRSMDRKMVVVEP